MLCALSQILESFATNGNNNNDNSVINNNSKSIDSQMINEAAQHARPGRRHLPLPTGPHTVGCVDLMCDLADDGAFFRLYYPTNKADILVSAHYF